MIVDGCSEAVIFQPLSLKPDNTGLDPGSSLDAPDKPGLDRNRTDLSVTTSWGGY
jgi:hypothetical protein